MAKKKRVLSNRQKFINKINARLRAQYAYGVDKVLLSQTLFEDVPGVIVYEDTGFITIAEEDFDKDLQATLEKLVKTKSAFAKSIESDEAYNLGKKSFDKTYALAKYHSRLFMNSVMDNQFKKYYDMVVTETVEKVETSPELYALKNAMGHFARALQASEKDKATTIYDTWINPLMKGKNLESLKEEVLKDDPSKSKAWWALNPKVKK